MSVFAPAQEALLVRFNRSLSALGSDVGSLNDDLAGTQLSFLALLQALASLVVPAGAVCSFAGTSAPDGWLVCDGAAVSRTTHAALFAQIGTAFGAGDGDATFNLPDLRDEFVRGSSATRAVGSWEDWATGAPKAKSAEAGRLLKDGTTNVDLSTYPNTALGFVRTTSATDPQAHSTVGPSVLNLTDNEPDLAFVANGDAETRPRNVALLYCIKT